MLFPTLEPGRCWRLPNEVTLHPRVLAAMLEAHGMHTYEVRAVDWARVRQLAALVRVVAGPHMPQLELGRPVIATVKVWSWPPPGTPLSVGRCSGTPDERAAMFLAMAWRDPTLRARLSESAWAQVLGPFTTPVTTKTARGPRHRGWLRARLLPPGEFEVGHHPVLHGALEIDLVRLALRDEQPLKPRSAPKSVHALRRLIRDPRPADVELTRLVAQRRLTARMDATRYNRAPLERADDALMAALAGPFEVTVGGEAVEVTDRAWPAAVTVADTDDGIALRWRTPILHYWPYGSGFVLDAARRLWRLPTARAPHLRALLTEGLPHVPTAEVPRFVREFLARSQLPVALDSARIATTVGTPTPRVRVDWADPVLTVDVELSYGEQRITPTTGALLLTDGAVVHRDYAAEEGWRLALGEAIERPVPAEYHGEAAHDFVLDTLPRLGGWAVDVDRGLLGRVRGDLSARVRFDSGIDWFDLDVHIEIDGQAVPFKTVLAAWRKGDRYVYLADGTVARLPEAWLGRHGEAAAELADLRRARRGRLRVHDAALLNDLLGEAPVEDALARWQDIALRISSFEGVPDLAPPPDLKATLRDYQHRGLRWMAALADLGLAGVLADDMGLGKTLQALAWVLHARTQEPGAGPCLVVAPTSVVHTWMTEAARFAPGLSTHLHHGANRGLMPTSVDLVVTSYGVLRHDAAVLGGRPWHAVVLDEAQCIKNPASATARAARRLHARHRFALTGTPLENHLVELWSLFEFLMPGFFGSKTAFTDRYARPIHDGRSPAALERLRARIGPFVLRRLKSEVAPELPARTVQIIQCELPPAQRTVYDALFEAYRESVLKQLEEDGLDRSRIHVLQALTRLRRACCHPRLVPLPQAQRVNVSAKLQTLEVLTDMLLVEGRRALVFSQWPSLLSLVREQLDARGVPYLYLDGATAQRALLQARWNRPDGPPLFLISIKAGGTGLTLTAADVVIHLDPWWNPAVENQATDRAHRIGQTRPVTVYKLVAKDTIEEKVLMLQQHKQSLFDATIDTGRLDVNRLTRDDIEAIFEDGPLSAFSVAAPGGDDEAQSA